VTATRDRRSDLDGAADGDVAWEERALLNHTRGWPWWGAVLLGFGLTAFGGILNSQLAEDLGMIFYSSYFVGCVAGICLVRRGSLFGPMVLPPLAMGLVVPLIVLGFTNAANAGGLRNQLLLIGTPLINGFPAMALTTAVTAGIGLLRIFVLQQDPNAPERRSRVSDVSDRAAKAAGRAASKAKATAKSKEDKPRIERRTQRPQSSGSSGSGGTRSRMEPPERSGGRGGRSGGTRTGSAAAREGTRDARRSDPPPRDRGTRQGGRPTTDGRAGREGTRSTPPPERSGRSRSSSSERSRSAQPPPRREPGRPRPTDSPPPRRRRDDQ
jgi:hypothetical protein